MPAFPLIEFSLSVGSWDTADEALPDTGFSGGVAIPEGVGRELYAESDSTTLWVADGALVRVPVWDGTLTLDEHEFEVQVFAIGNQYLIGRRVLDQLDICFRFGREVTLRFSDD